MKTLQPFVANGYSWRRSHDGMNVSIVKDPRNTMRSSDDGRDIEALIATLQVVTANSFGIPLAERSADGVRRHVVDVHGLAFLHDEDSVLGFASALLFPEDDIFYLHGVAIDASSKRKGGARTLVRSLVDTMPCGRMAFTTQNPAMYCFLKSLYWSVYPSVDAREVPESVRDVGVRLTKERTGALDPRTFVVENLYGKCLYENVPESTEPQVNRWFRESLAIENGVTRNAFLFVAEHAR